MYSYQYHEFLNKQMYSSYVWYNCSFPHHFHEAFEIIFVADGNLLVTIDDADYELKADDLAFIFPNQMHSFESRGYSHLVFLLFPPDVIPEFYNNYYNKLPKSNVITWHSVPHDSLVFNNVYETKSFLYRMCGLLVEHTDFIIRSASANHNNLLHLILNYIYEHYNETCSLSQVSKNLGYDYYYLSRFFSDNLGISFSEYLNRYRISQACLMLINDTKSISSIATMCGYDNIRTFNRNFFKHTNTTPTEYKRLNS